MRLLHFLNEETTNSEEIIKILKKDCSEFLKLTNINNPLYRGLKFNMFFEKIKLNKNRKPVDMEQNISDILDDGFNSIFKVKARSQSIFCSGLDSNASKYGILYYIFPIKKFNYIWSPIIEDLYKDCWRHWLLKDDISKIFIIYLKYKNIDYVDTNKDFIFNYYNLPKNDQSIETIKSIFNSIKDKEMKSLRDNYIEKTYIKNEKFLAAIQSKNEIMINCNYYYALIKNNETEKEIWNKIF